MWHTNGSYWDDWLLVWFQQKQTGRLQSTVWCYIEGEFVQYHTVRIYLIVCSSSYIPSLFGVTGEAMHWFPVSRVEQLLSNLLNFVSVQFGVILPVITQTSMSSQCDTIQLKSPSI